MIESRISSASDVTLTGDLSLARASPVCDARRPHPTSVNSGRGLPDQERIRLKKLVQTRVGTLNVGSMTAKGREIVDLMTRRKVEVLCVQDGKEIKQES